MIISVIIRCFIISYLLIYLILHYGSKYASKNRLLDKPVDRKTHKAETGAPGGFHFLLKFHLVSDIGTHLVALIFFNPYPLNLVPIIHRKEIGRS
jgi:UDP-N-acetylmuramyl pentapeptide phosphotransferase/UDP-N-acetylglucosamine-1-phosphate transferase